MLNGMMWIARSGAQWRELPEKVRTLANCVFQISEME
ncbi:MAG: transposase [Ruminococcaceae bacterium]|nr:transposase [Oscillospiraceae bacterium]